MNQFRFNFLKIIKSKFNWLLLVFLIAGVGLTLFFHHRNNQTMNFISIAQEENQTTKVNIRSWRNKRPRLIKKYGRHSDEVQANIDSVKESQAEFQQKQQMIKAYQRGDLHKAYQIQVQRLTFYEQVAKQDKSYNSPELLWAMKRQRKFYQALDQRQVYSDVSEFPINGWTFLLKAFQTFIPVGLVLILVFMLSQLYTSEFHDMLDIGGLWFRSKPKRLLNNIGFGFILGVSFLMLTLIVAFLMASSFARIGNLNYPILTYQHGKVSYEDLSQILSPALLLSVMTLLFVSASVYLLAQWIKNRSATLFVSLLILVGVPLLTNIIQPLQTVAQYLPTTYLNSVLTVTGQLARQLHNQAVTFSTGISVSLLGTLVVIACTLGLMFWRRQRLVKA